MKQNRRGLVGTITAGITAGLAGCSYQVFTGTPTPQPQAKVYVSKDTLTIEPRGATLYGQIDAKGLTAKSVPDPHKFDISTGSFSVSGSGTTTVSFESESLTAISIIADSGRFDLLAKGRIIKRDAQEYSGALRQVPITPQQQSPSSTSARQTDPSTRIFASQESIVFDLKRGVISGQIGAVAIEGLDLEPEDEIDPSTGRFFLSGDNQDRIRFEPNSLSAMSIIAEKGNFDIFYRGELLGQRVTEFSQSFQPDTSRESTPQQSYVDDFKRGISAYSIEKGDPHISKDIAHSGNQSLALPASGPSRGMDAILLSLNGLDQYPAVGNTVRYRFRTENPAAKGGSQFYFGLQHPDESSGYTIATSYLDEFNLFEEGDVVDKANVTYNTDSWHTVEIEWQSDSLSAKLITDDGEEIASLYADDLNKDIRAGGIGFGSWANFNEHVTYFDSVEIV